MSQTRLVYLPNVWNYFIANMTLHFNMIISRYRFHRLPAILTAQTLKG